MMEEISTGKNEKRMKKIFVLAAICSTAALMAVSCSKASQDITSKQEPTDQTEQQPQDVKLVDVCLSAGVEEPDTKVFSSGNTLKWNGSADKLAVFAEAGGTTALYQFDKAAGSSATSAEFTGKIPEGATLKYAAYPYSQDRSCNGNVLGLLLNHKHSCDATNSIPHNTPLYGIVSGSAVTMKSPCAYLKVMLPKKSDDSTLEIYDSLRVAANACAGNFTVDLATPATPVVSAGDLNELAVAPRKSQSGYVFVPILPGTYNDITISLEYNEGHAAFSKQSTQTQIFESGYVYDCHEFAGPYVESVTTGSPALEGTTLSLSASAVLWKYAGVSNSNYTCKFFYSEAGLAKDAAGWTEVAATVDGSGSAVTLSGSATVAAGASYQCYAQVSDGSLTIDGEIAGADAPTVVEFVFSEMPGGNPYSFAYTTLSQGKNDGMKMITDAQGNPVIPTFKPGSGTSYYYKAWNATAGEYGSVASATAVPNGLQQGMTVSKGNYSISFPTLSSSGSASYYSIYSSLLCVTNNKYVTVNATSGQTIKSITLKCTASKTCTWGVGTAASTRDILASTDYNNNDYVKVKVNIPAETQAAGKKFYVISGINNNRLSAIEVEYAE